MRHLAPGPTVLNMRWSDRDDCRRLILIIRGFSGKPVPILVHGPSEKIHDVWANCELVFIGSDGYLGRLAWRFCDGIQRLVVNPPGIPEKWIGGTRQKLNRHLIH